MAISSLRVGLLAALALIAGCRSATSKTSADAQAILADGPSIDMRDMRDMSDVAADTGPPLCAGCSLPPKCGQAPDPCACPCNDGDDFGPYVCQGGCRIPRPDAAAGDGATAADARDDATTDATRDAVNCSSPCPAAAPRAGESCSCAARCHYYDCGGRGRVTATCGGASGWQTSEIACAAYRCASIPCAAGEICIVSIGGAAIPRCVKSACGSGPVTCACAQSVCPSPGCSEGTQFIDGDLTCGSGCTSPPCPP
jgi:hypothetical protein